MSVLFQEPTYFPVIITVSYVETYPKNRYNIAYINVSEPLLGNSEFSVRDARNEHLKFNELFLRCDIIAIIYAILPINRVKPDPLSCILDFNHIA